MNLFGNFIYLVDLYYLYYENQTVFYFGGVFFVDKTLLCPFLSIRSRSTLSITCRAFWSSGCAGYKSKLKICVPVS